MSEIETLKKLSGIKQASYAEKFALDRSRQAADFLISMSEDLNPEDRRRLIEHVVGKLNESKRDN